MNSFIKICGLVASLQFIGIQALEAATLSLNPSTQSVISDDFVSLDVNVGGLTDQRVGAYDLNLSYDPLLLDFESLTFGTELGYDDDPLLSSAADYDDSIAGLLNVFEVSFLDPTDLLINQPTDFTLFSVTFKTKSYGTALLGLTDIVLGDEWGDPLAVDLGNSLLAASIDIQRKPDGNIPEPSSLLLLGLGLPILLCRFGKIST